MKNLIYILLLILLTFQAKAQDTTKINYGSLEGGIYSNQYLNFRISIPSSWSIQNKEQLEQLYKVGEKLISEKKEDLKPHLDLAKERSLFLLSAFKYEKGSPVEFNPSIAIVAENLSSVPGIKSGHDYLFHAKKFMETTGQHTKISKQILLDKNLGNEFYYIDTELKSLDKKINQRFYSIIRKNYALAFILSYSGKAELKELLKILDTIK